MKIQRIFGFLIFGAAIGTLGFAYAWARLRSELGGGEATGPPLVIISSAESHAVTPEMLATTAEMTDQAAPAFQAEASDGKTYDLAELVQERPLALVFIKDGCPCSEESAPFHNRLHQAYAANVSFFGVIDGDVACAKRWAERNGVSFPILADPSLAMVHQYRAENSAYFAVVSRGGTIQAYWPGYSAGMLQEASDRLAEVTGATPAPFDVAGAPSQLYSGCPY